MVDRTVPRSPEAIVEEFDKKPAALVSYINSNILRKYAVHGGHVNQLMALLNDHVSDITLPRCANNHFYYGDALPGIDLLIKIGEIKFPSNKKRPFHW